MDLIEVARVCDWLNLKNCTDFQAFLSFTNFYWRFICRFLDIAYSFFDLTGSNSIWIYTVSQQDAFNLLKVAITFVPILTFSDISISFQIKTDSSDFATRTILSQESRANSKWYPIVFFSKSLSLVECNYEIHDKKILAIIHALGE